MMNHTKWLAVLALAGFAAACGDSDPSGPVNQPGTFDLEVVGDIEETAEGPAWFGSDVNDDGDPVFALVLGDEDSRHLLIAGKLGSSRPAVGTYDIAAEAWDLVHFLTEDDELYGLFMGVEGEVTITESSSSRLRGTITFVAEGFLGVEDAAVEGTVSFDARPATATSFQAVSAVRSNLLLMQ